MSLALVLTLITVVTLGCWAAWQAYRGFKADDLGSVSDDKDWNVRR